MRMYKIKQIRILKTQLIELRKKPYVTKEIKKWIDNFCKQVPSRDADLEYWLNINETAFKGRMQELENEHDYIQEQAQKLYLPWVDSLTFDWSLRKKTEEELKKVPIIKKKRGGKREGAGRKQLGITKKVSITLTEHEWQEIEQQIEAGAVSSVSEYFRNQITKK